MTRRSLLASLMALSLLCGGLGVASAANGTVHVAESSASSDPAVYTTEKVDTLLKDKADKTALDTKANETEVVKNTENIATNKENIQRLDTDKLSKDAASATYATNKALNDLENAVTNKVDESVVEEALDGKANTDLSNLTPDGVNKIKETMSADMENKANKDTVTALVGRVGGLEATVGGASRGLVKGVADLNAKTTKITYDAALGTNVDGVTFNAGAVTGVTFINGTKIGTPEDGKYISQDGSIWGNMKKVDTQVEINVKNIETNKTAITNLDTGLKQEVKDRIAEDTALSDRIGTVTEDGNYIKESGTNNVSANLKVLDAWAKTNTDAIAKETADREAAIGELAVNGNYIKKDKNVSDNLVELDKQAKANDDAITKTNQRTAGITRDDTKKETSIEGRVTVDTNGNIKAEGTITSNGLDARAGEIKTTGKVSAGDVSTGTLETTGNAKIGGDLTVNGKLNVGEIYMEHKKKESTGEEYDSATSITADSISNNAKVTDKNGVTTESKFTHDKEGSTTYAYQGDAANWKKSTSNVTADGVENVVKDSKGNNNTFTQTSTDTKNILKDQDGNTSTTRQDSKGIYGYAKDKDGNKSYTKQEGNRIAESVIGQDGKQTKSEMTSTDITNTAKDGIITNTAQNVTNEGTESVTNKVGNNEVKVSTDGVDITVDAGKTIKESVGAVTSRTMTDGNIIDQAGDMTVTTDKTTGTTFGNGTPKDITVINGGTIGTNKVNANETNTKKLTAGAAADAEGGRLTVDANDGVKGSYNYGDYTSRSYILANTLQSGVDNGKNITDNGFVGSRTDHYMDGDKAKLNETVKDADGSNVTKKTSTKTYTEIKDTNGNTLSVNQKADGNNYKLEDQDGNTNHVTNSATQSKQTLKDKAGNTLTTNQTATKNNFDLKSADGSKENHTTNTVDESRVAIKGENGKAELSTTDEGTTFKHSAAKEAFTEGGATNTTIKGNTITTGKVTMDYADVMKNLGVYGNATVDKDMTVKGNTTLGEAGKDTTLIVNSKATFNEIATFENGAEVNNGLTVSSGGLNVTGESMFNDKVTMNNGLDVTGGVASDSFTVKGTDIKIDSSGINAGGTVISNVADGSISEGSKDAVNGGQLYQVKNDLEGKVNKVGANAAAMANLHPMEFDPDSKWNIAAAIGNYGSETAAALGAFYRPNDDVMVNLSTAFGTGENMVGGGVSVRLGKSGNKLSREESNALKDQVNDLTARMDALLSVLNPNMSKDFPDVPENHWAYEAVSRLAGNDIVQGYPDGEFHGERTMTRYEMAEIIYNALSRGAEAEKELVEEFKPELQAMAASEKATAERAEG